MTYELTIKLLNEIEYKGIIAYKNNKFYIRTLIDSDEYELMMKELLFEKGYISLSPIDEINFDVNITKFDDINQFFEFLKEKGFDIEYKPIDNFVSFSVIADGDDLLPETIAIMKEGTKIINFAQALSNFSNNTYYEPKIQIRASSFAVDVQEEVDSQKIKEIITKINNSDINIDEYFTNNLYKKLIDSLIELSKIKTLNKLFIKINNENIIIDKHSILNIKNYIKEILNKKIFETTTPYHNLRAFDEKKYKVILDTDNGVFYLHLNKNLLAKLKDYYSQKYNIKILGYFKKPKTINVTTVEIG